MLTALDRYPCYRAFLNYAILKFMLTISFWQNLHTCTRTTRLLLSYYTLHFLPERLLVSFPLSLSLPPYLGVCAMNV